MFNQALSEVGPVNGIRGTWNPSMPSNLDGGEVFTFTPPSGGRVFPSDAYALGPGEAWFHHTVVVKREGIRPVHRSFRDAHRRVETAVGQPSRGD